MVVAVLFVMVRAVVRVVARAVVAAVAAGAAGWGRAKSSMPQTPSLLSSCSSLPATPLKGDTSRKDDEGGGGGRRAPTPTPMPVL